MTSHDRFRALRQYLLGAATDDDCAAIERTYFEGAVSLREVCDVEDDLIAEYLDGRLTGDERDRFERHYLASPRHRTRVAVVRALQTHTTGARQARVLPLLRLEKVAASIRAWPAVPQIAAALALATLAGAIWTFNSGSPAPPAVSRVEPSAQEPGSGQPQIPSATRAPRRVIVALTIAPVSVRSGGDPATLVIPVNGEVVALELQNEPGQRSVDRARGVVRTVAGAEVWQGPAAQSGAARADNVTRLEVPAALLSAEDYIAQLFDVDAGGHETERNRYFFRVRER